MDPPNAGQVSPERWICTSGQPPPPTAPSPELTLHPFRTACSSGGASSLSSLSVYWCPTSSLPGGATSSVRCNRPVYDPKWSQSPPSSASASGWRFPGQEPTCSAVGPVALTPAAPRVSHAVPGRSRCPCLPLSASSGCVAAIPPGKLAPAAPALDLGGGRPPGSRDPLPAASGSLGTWTGREVYTTSLRWGRWNVASEKGLILWAGGKCG